jgi:hypothetical protein
MPTLVWLYLTALLYYRTSASCVALAQALQMVSHDRLTRVLQADWFGQRLLEHACHILFVSMGVRCVTIDATPTGPKVAG